MHFEHLLMCQDSVPDIVLVPVGVDEIAPSLGTHSLAQRQTEKPSDNVIICAVVRICQRKGTQ